MDLIYLILILFLGVLAGFLNTIAGGGSLLTMPALIFLGLPPAVANGTNRIALVVQNIVAILNFRKNGYFEWKLSIMLGIPAIIGSVFGANVAISLPDHIFNKLLALVMFMVLALTIWQPEKKFKADGEKMSPLRKVLAIISFFFIGFYGGFIQAGVGFIIITSLTLITGMSLVKINSIKVFVILAYMFSSFAIFLYNGQVDWLLGITLAFGNGVGGWLGSHFAVKKGDQWIRGILIIAVSVMALKLLFS